MDRVWYNLIIVLNLLHYSNLVVGETYSVKIGGEHVNIVDKNFLSFTVDPTHLFSSVEAYNDKECTCMASFLTPAYLRIAGPSTTHMTFENTTITIDTGDDYETIEKSNKNFFKNLLRKRKRQVPQSIKITNRQWREFIKWSEKTGFDIVFALNNDEKTSSGFWDTKSTLTVLNLAEKANIKNIVWQLGYECNSKTIDEYLNDLESLRVLVETVQGDKTLGWRTAGSDVTKCLKDASDFRDYVALAVDMTDVLLLNGNSSSQELERMSTTDRVKLLTLLHRSSTPLWITEQPQYNTALERAADWMASLGYSARNGFSVHFRELMAEELYEPTLSFYMALLYKNFVGERVLPVNFDSSQITLFAHCTSLRHKPVPRAVTLYGVNMDDEPARLSLKLARKEEGGEIMQFIMNQDKNGDILVNGQVMTREGGFRPVVRHVGPYKTLLIHLPAKSFGFWILANTNIAACQNIDKELELAQSNKTENVDVKKEKSRTKRSTTNDHSNTDSYDIELDQDLDNSIDTVALKEIINNLNNELRDAENFFSTVNRFKRQTYNEHERTRKLRKPALKPKKDIRKYDDFENKPILSLIGNLIQLTRKNATKVMRKPLRLHKKRYGSRYHYDRLQNTDEINQNKGSRSKRSIINDKYEGRYKYEDLIKENEINKEDDNIWNVANGIQDHLEHLSNENSDHNNILEDAEKSSEKENFSVSTEISDDGATINFKESPGHGVIKTTIDNLFSMINELNRNINKFWTELSLFD